MSACKTPWYSASTRHTWGPWKDKEEGNMLKPGTKQITGRVVIQERRCLNADCNKLEMCTAYSDEDSV